MGKLEHYAELTKRLKERVINLEKNLKDSMSFVGVNASTLQFAMTPTPSRVTKATYERARAVLNMNTVKSRMVIRAHKVILPDNTVKNVNVNTDIRAKNLTKTINDILHKDYAQSEVLDAKLDEILYRVYKVDSNNLEAGKEYNGFKISKDYKPNGNLAEYITFDKVSPGLASKIAEVTGTNPITTNIASPRGNLNLQTWKDAFYTEDRVEAEAKRQKVAKMISANAKLYEDFEDVVNNQQLFTDLNNLMKKSQSWQIAKKNEDDSDQVKENWTKLYVKGSEARKNSTEAWDAFRRMIKNPDKYETQDIIDAVDAIIAKNTKK